MLAKIANYVALAWSRLTTFFVNNLDFRALLSALGAQAQEVEEAIYSTGDLVRDITNATGATLDNLGALVGAPLRGILSDAQYRTRILVQIRLNGYGGTQAEAYALAKLVVPAWNLAGQPSVADAAFVGVYEIKSNPANSVVVSSSEARTLAQMLSNHGPTGYRCIVYSTPQPIAQSFGFANSGGLGFGAGRFVGAYDK